MRYCRYIIAAFFLALFIFNGAGNIAPKLFPGSEIAKHKFFSTESEKGEKETTERPITEIKELYVNNSFLSNLFIIHVNTTEQNPTRFEIMRLEVIHTSIPTPPPEGTAV